MLVVQAQRAADSCCDAVVRTKKQLDSLVPEPSANSTRSPKIMTYAEMKNLERENVIAALKATNYRIYGAGGAAELLGLKPTTLASRIKALRIPLRPGE